MILNFLASFNMKFIKLFTIQFVLLVLSIFLGWMALFAVHSLPQNIIQDHIYKSAKFFEKNYVHTMGDNSGMLDMFTDARMLITAGTPNNKPASEAALENLTYSANKGPSQFIKDFFGSQSYERSATEPGKFSHARYWHGYLVILRPLLLVTDYGNIRHLNMICQLFLVFTTAFILFKRKLFYLSLITPLIWLIMNPVSTILCLQFNTVTCITFLAILGIALFKENLIQSTLASASYFTLLGASVNFFDFLSFPLISLGIPLIFLIYSQYGFQIKDYKPLFQIALLSFCWFLGYGGMWVGKWLLAALYTDINVLEQVVHAITLRSSTSVNGNSIGYVDVIKKNFSSLNIGWVLFFGFSFFISLVTCFIPRYVKYFTRKAIIIYFTIFIYPFIWLFFLQNHSFVHAWFVFRILSVSFIVATLIPIHLIFYKLEASHITMNNSESKNPT